MLPYNLLLEKPSLNTTVTVGQYNYYVICNNPLIQISELEQEIFPDIQTNGTLIIEEKAILVDIQFYHKEVLCG